VTERGKGSDPLIGRVLGKRYRVERKVGSGGMGAVYEAVQLDLGRRVALKTLLEVRGVDDLERFRDEALAAASLNHPNIVQVTDFGPADGDAPAFLVMELLAGRSLARLVAARGKLPARTAVHVALQILDGLAAAHAARVLHRDIKPGNVVVLDDGVEDAPWIKIVDFGIAKLMDDESRSTATGVLLGTPAYMAPEQLLGSRADEQTDIYAVGVCMFEMLAGRRAFAGSGGELVGAITRGETPALRGQPGVSEALADVVARAMQRDPLQRYANARAMSDALRAALAPPKRAPRRTMPLVFAVGCLAALALGVGTFVALRPPEATFVAAPAVDAAMADIDPPRSEPPTAENAQPAVSASNDASSARRAPCVCVDDRKADRWSPLCPSVQRTCNCFDEVRLCLGRWDSASWGSCSKDEVVGDARAYAEGASCRGTVLRPLDDGGYESIPATGTWTCVSGCSWQYLRKHAALAVPGTPCSGYLSDEREAGHWVELSELK
jgi:hypothetical protein